MTDFTRNLFLTLFAVSLFIAAISGLMTVNNRGEEAAKRSERATAWVTATADSQLRYALSSNMAQRAVEMYERNPRIALLLALEALAHKRPAYDLPYATQHALWQVLMLGTVVELDERADVPPERLEQISRNGRWRIEINDIDDVILHDQSATTSPAAHTLLWGSQYENLPARISEDNRWLAFARQGEDCIYVWDLQSEKWDRPDTFDVAGIDVTSVELSPNGRWLAAGSTDDIVRLWSLDAAEPASSVQLLRQFDHADNSLDREGHLDEVTELAFSPDSRWLATGSRDDSVRLWDLTTLDVGHWPILLAEPLYDIERLFFTPDGMQLYATGARVTYVWNVDMPSLESKACQMTNGAFAEWEWHDYMPELPYRHTCRALQQ